ncbi:MAG: 30S ribosome-binding factor RbfA [Desulfuromonadales bacterium]|nr:30S ribosome-binding factor RbfA [Desulfuromonadales bacterium]
MATQRAHKVGEQIHKEISELLQRGLRDPRIGFVTIMGVEMTPDLQLARVFFSVIGDEKARQETEKGLRNAAPFLRRELGQRLRLRRVPELLFQYDSSIEYGNRIESLLREIHVDDSDDQGHSDEN